MHLNPEQQVLFDKIVGGRFNKLLVLGNGGTGKTFSTCKAVSQLVRRGARKLVVCAPTHLARLNITEKLDEDIRDLTETCTVASLLMKFGVNADDGSVQFTSGKIDRINKYEIVVLDECSMISDSDYKVLMASRAKIIFLGDMAQLPPVMAKSASESMDGHIVSSVLEVYTLTTQMRQKGVILSAAERNRTEVWFPGASEVGEEGESIDVHRTTDDLINTMVRNMVTDGRRYNSTLYHRYITYRNSDVRAVGKAVRDRLIEHYFGSYQVRAPFTPGEYLMLRENKAGIGYNGELVKVEYVKYDSCRDPWESYELKVRGSAGAGVIKTIPPCQRNTFDDHMRQLQSWLHGQKIRGQARDADRTLREIKRLRSYWTLTQYPYAVTTHKSQGMTIENVYLDTISFVSAPSRRALLYVGISRASKSLHTVLVPEEAPSANARYRKAREMYELMTGESYRAVLRRLRVSTSTPQGKEIVAGYLEALVDDLSQGEGGEL